MVNSEVSEVHQPLPRHGELPVDLTMRARFNPQLDNVWFGSINNIITNITMLSIILTGAALIREREHGTIEHLLVMPVTPFEIMVSKVLAMSLVVLVASGASRCSSLPIGCSKCRSRDRCPCSWRARRCAFRRDLAQYSWRRSPAPCRSSACC